MTGWDRSGNRAGAVIVTTRHSRLSACVPSPCQYLSEVERGLGHLLLLFFPEHSISLNLGFLLISPTVGPWAPPPSVLHPDLLGSKGQVSYITHETSSFKRL